jgi:hypothetical protein
MDFWKKNLPQGIAFLSGLVVILSFFSGPGVPGLKSVEEEVWKWIQIIISFSMFLGVISLVSLNVRKIVQRASNWGYNAVLLGAFLVMTGLSLFIGLEPTYQPGDAVWLMSDVPGAETGAIVVDVRPASPTGILLQVQVSTASSTGVIGTTHLTTTASSTGVSGTTHLTTTASSTGVIGTTHLTTTASSTGVIGTTHLTTTASSTGVIGTTPLAAASSAGFSGTWPLATGNPVVHGWRRARNRPDGEAFFGPLLTVSTKKVKTATGYRAWQAQYVLFYGIFKAGQATLFSLLAFFMASAVYRAFRVRTLDSGILLGSAVIVMLGNIPLGNVISATIRGWGLPFPGLSEAREWILSFPSSAAQSAILIGAVLGYLASALKNLLGIETAFLGIKKP